MPSSLRSLKGIGPKTAVWLEAVGITTAEALAELGSVEAYRRLKASRPRDVTLNALYGLEAALMGISWLELPDDIKAALRRQVE